MHAIDEIEVRDRYWGLIRKVKSLKFAVDERRNRIYTLQDIDGTRNLKSARVRAPKYVTALQNMLERDIRTLRQEYERGKSLTVYQNRHVTQLEGLLGDLETKFEAVVQSLYVPARPAPKRLASPSASAAGSHMADTECPSTHGTDSTSDVIASHMESVPKCAILQTPDTLSVHSCSSSLLPDIKLLNHTMIAHHMSPRRSDPDEVSLPLAANHLPEKQTASAPVGHVTADEPTRPNGGVTRGYTSLNKHQLRTPLDMTVRRRSVVGYPYTSSFPALPPLPVNRQKTIIDNKSSNSGAETEGEHTRPRLRRNNTLFVNKNLREKTWYY